MAEQSGFRTVQFPDRTLGLIYILPLANTTLRQSTLKNTSSRPKYLLQSPTPKKTMVKIRKFHLFNKLPVELQLMVYEFAQSPRIIRARWQMGLGDHSRPMIGLSAGPVPIIMHINSDSRRIGLQKYKLTLSRSTFHKDQSNNHVDMSSIYINWEIDTLYFVNMPELAGCLTWMKNIIANAPIKQIAFTAHTGVVTLYQSIHKNFFFLLLQQHPTLETFGFVLENSKFPETLTPAKYKLHDFIPTNSYRGRKWCHPADRINLQTIGNDIVQDHWQAPRAGFGGVAHSRKASEWNQFWVANGGMNFKGPEWKLYTINMK